MVPTERPMTVRELVAHLYFTWEMVDHLRSVIDSEKAAPRHEELASEEELATMQLIADRIAALLPRRTPKEAADFDD